MKFFSKTYSQNSLSFIYFYNNWLQFFKTLKITIICFGAFGSKNLKANLLLRSLHIATSKKLLIYGFVSSKWIPKWINVYRTKGHDDNRSPCHNPLSSLMRLNGCQMISTDCVTILSFNTTYYGNTQ